MCLLKAICVSFFTIVLYNCNHNPNKYSILCRLRKGIFDKSDQYGETQPKPSQAQILQFEQSHQQIILRADLPMPEKEACGLLQDMEI